MTWAKKAKNRITLLAILAVFVAPFTLAWVFALGPLQWRPRSTLNHGVLLQPPLSLHAYGAEAADGGAFNLDAIAGDWFLVVLHTSSCAAVCRELARTASSIRLAVGRDSHRVKIALLGPEQAAPSRPDGNWRLPANNKFAADLSRAIGEEGLDNLLLTVDYQGYIVLAYPSLDPSIEDVYGPLRDLERLLSAVPN